MTCRNKTGKNGVPPGKFLVEPLKKLYETYNDPALIHPDPLELVVPWTDVRDREIAALIASAFAYGRVHAILNCVKDLLNRMNGRPGVFVRDSSEETMRAAFTGFKYRFHTGNDVFFLLSGAREMIREYGSLGEAFASGVSDGDKNVFPALEKFSNEICRFFPNGESTLFSSPSRGSACKRSNLMLRWLVRHDPVDPGGWEHFIPASKLVVPLDTHMHRLGTALGLTARKAADGRTALEITHSFAGLFPDDPVRFDFALTRFGIHPGFDLIPPDFLFLKRKK